MASLPLVMTAAGPQPTALATLHDTLLANAAAAAPGYTASLPGSLVEDVSSTDVAALALLDQARVEAVNALTPYGANAYLLAQLGQLFGIPAGQSANAQVQVVFSGTAGYVISPGVLVSDGTNQYRIVDGGAIGSSGQSPQLTAIAVNAGVFPIPANSVTQVITATGGVALSVTNPQAGTPATDAESTDAYRGRILTAFQNVAIGTPSAVRTALLRVSGVQARLVSVIASGSGWEVICGGGDATQVATAILQSVPDIATLVGSSTTSRNVSVSLFQQPNTYNVTYVNPPAQVVTVTLTWNTQLPNFTQGAAVNAQAAPAVANYINSIPVGNPINLLALNAAVQTAVAGTIDPANLTTLAFTVTVNGSAVVPSAGTSAIASDPESYFTCASTAVTVTQG